MRIRPLYVLLLPPLLVAVACGGYFAHRPKTSPPLAPITKGMTNKQIEAHFDLGTNKRGIPAYTHFKCGKEACEWVYGGAKKGLMAVLVVAMPPGSIPHGPPPKDN